MTILILCVALLVPGAAMAAQQAVAADTSAQVEAAPGAAIASVDVSGLDTNDLSPGLRGDIDGLVGTPLAPERLRALAARIEDERPDVIAEPRSAPLPDGRVRVTFSVTNLADEAANVNARYEVESVAIDGVDQARVSQPLRDDLQALVGNRLSPSAAERLEQRLASELRGYDVRRRLSRGSAPGLIRVIFEVRERDDFRWIPFAPSASKLVYHSTHAWSGALDVPIGGRHHRATIGLIFGDEDGRIEERAGYGIRIESRRLGTDRLGVSFELAHLRQTWEPETLTAIDAPPAVADAYRSRLLLEPVLTVGLTPSLRARAGVSLSELESLSRSPAEETASAALGALVFRRRWDTTGGTRHTLEAGYEVRAGTEALESDLLYTRHTGDVRYTLERGTSVVLASGALGRVGGRAPLFERFTLGDASTLRGWNKYELAPAGAERMVHQSTEYRYRRFAVFADIGALWAPGAERDVRVSTGFGFHGDEAFLTLAFPVNAGELRAAFMAGVRF